MPSSSTKHQHHSSPGSSERMIGCESVGGVAAGVAVGRVVAAADVAALQADAQVQPHAALAQAVLAAVDGLGELGDVDGVQMGADGFPVAHVLSIANSSSGPVAAPGKPDPAVQAQAHRVADARGRQRRHRVQPSGLRA